MQTKTIKTVEASDLPIDDLTEVVLEGSGVFDKFLTLHRAVLDREFKQGRIVGKEYSDTFTRTYSANLEMAIQFLFAKEKQAYEIELLEGQMCNLEKDCETKQYNLDFMLPKELEIKDAQILKMQADTAIAEKELELKTSMLPLTISLTRAQIDKMQSDAAIAKKELELRTVMLPLTVALTTAQVAKTESDVLLANKQLELADKELLLKEKQLLQQDKQLELLEEQLLLQKQKIVTEKAQVDPSVVNSGSIIDTNIKALEAQIEGMDRDAKQKVMNMMVGVFNTRINNDTGEPKPDNYMTDRALASVVKDTLESVGMTVLPDTSL